MNNGLFRRNGTRRDHGWRFLQPSPNICKGFFFFFLVDCNGFVCHAGRVHGSFSWLRSNHVSSDPKAWVRAGIFCVNHKKSLSKPWCNGVKYHHQLNYPPHQHLGWQCRRHVGNMSDRQPNVGTFDRLCPVMPTQN